MGDQKESEIKSFSTMLSKSPTSETIGIKVESEGKESVSSPSRTLN
jgi:hypothetical protein